MKCSKCGNEMKQGNVVANGGIFWSNVKKQVRFTTINTENLTPIPLLTMAQLEGYRCEICKLVLMKYN